MKSKALFALLFLSSYTFADQAPPQEPRYIQYHNRISVFSPCHQTYERIKNDAFYAGVEAYAVSAINKSDCNTLLDAELRMGYNFFFRGREHITPFAGIGYVQDFYKHHHLQGVLYGSLGFLYTHEFNTIFNLGLNGKLLVGGPVTGGEHHWGAPVVGADLALPITFRFGKDRHWDYRIEPFALFLHGSENSEDFWGFRGTIGYRF
ncbi:MAG: hypothetical protein JSS61_04325 [Verrucomicrobia bacterium]|nr:hypothetical protein [Verrucomicrobiota bacterium]